MSFNEKAGKLRFLEKVKGVRGGGVSFSGFPKMDFTTLRFRKIVIRNYASKTLTSGFFCCLVTAKRENKDAPCGQAKAHL